MISFNASEWQGLEGMGEEMLREMKPKADRLMWKAGTEFQAALKAILTGKRSGKPYVVTKGGRIHIASAPGEPPALLWGNLRNSMGFSRPKWAGWTISMEVGSGLGVRATGDVNPDEYATRLEYGGYNSAGVYIARRPYMAPTEAKMEPVLQKLFEAGL